MYMYICRCHLNSNNPTLKGEEKHSSFTAGRSIHFFSEPHECSMGGLNRTAVDGRGDMLL